MAGISHCSGESRRDGKKIAQHEVLGRVLLRETVPQGRLNHPHAFSVVPTGLEFVPPLPSTNVLGYFLAVPAGLFQSPFFAARKAHGWSRALSDIESSLGSMA